MRQILFLSLTLILAIGSTTAEGVEYVTDLPAFSDLVRPIYKLCDTELWENAD